MCSIMHDNLNQARKKQKAFLKLLLTKIGKNEFEQP